MIFDFLKGLTKTASTPQTTRMAVADLDPFAYSGQTGFAPAEQSIFDGSKFAGGFGPTQLLATDYWTLRARSAQLFKDNLYARGLIRRLVTNEITTGLTPEFAPDETILGVTPDSLNAWTEETENRFSLWAKNPKLCDWFGQKTFGEIQQVARQEALIEGDILIVLRHSRRTRLPAVQLIAGSAIQTPLARDSAIRDGHTVKHGVEFDAVGREVAYWVRQKEGGSKRLPARGEKSGRRLAWLVFGTDKRLDDVRGEPLLSLILQSLKEIDRYRDSAQRKAVVNSILAMFIKKGTDKAGSLPIQGGATRHDEVEVPTADGSTRSLEITRQIPGVVAQELQVGEEPVGFSSQGTDLNFGEFEKSIISAVAWANEVPPEILTLAFSNNYSASQAAINEFKIYLNKQWVLWGDNVCSPIAIEWLINETLLQKIKAPGLLEAWRDSTQYDIFGAWTVIDWYGSIKPSTDMLKQAKGSKLLVEEGWSTNAREARVTTGTKFSKNIKRLTQENRLKAEAARPFLELQAEFGTAEADAAVAAVTAMEDTVITALDDLREASS